MDCMIEINSAGLSAGTHMLQSGYGIRAVHEQPRLHIDAGVDQLVS
jgi:hypothetical protein